MEWAGEAFDRQVKSFIRSAQSALVPQCVHLPSVKASTNELNTVTELSKALQTMNRRNFGAAGPMGVTALLSALGRFLG